MRKDEELKVIGHFNVKASRRTGVLYSKGYIELDGRREYCLLIPCEASIEGCNMLLVINNAMLSRKRSPTEEEAIAKQQRCYVSDKVDIPQPVRVSGCYTKNSIR